MIDEVFPRPTVKTVIFQIRFPNLFYIESKIGEIQLKIMDEFPESSLQIRRNIIVADLGPDASVGDIPQEFAPEPAKKIWQFKSPKKYELHILSDSLDLTSQYHKSYDRPDVDNRFRDAIEKAVGSFFGVTRVPIISRIGLRYVNACPIPAKSTDEFKQWYKTTFPLDRFPLQDAEEMVFRTVVKRGDLNLGYVELFGKKDKDNEEEGYRLVLDIDAFATQVRSDDYLGVTDRLHNLIVTEFLASIRQPLIDYMRKSPGA